MFARGERGVRVGVVTDSTSCLPAELVEPYAAALAVVPLTVSIDGASFVEGESVTSDEVADAQARGAALTTSRPSPGRMAQAYEQLASQGCTHLVSVHASAELSSTVNSAHLAAAESPVPVVVIDSTTLGMAMGFAVLAGARRAARGGGVEAVAATVRQVAGDSRTAFYVDSLEPLRRGGRVGRAGAWLGSALSIKPLLQVRDGVIEPLARVRTTGKAIERLGAWGAATARELHRDGDTLLCAVHALERTDLALTVAARLDPATQCVKDAEDPEKPGGAPHPGRADGGGAVPEAGQAPESHSGDERAQRRRSEGLRGRGGEADESPEWAAPIVHAKLGAVVTAHVGAGAVAVVVARVPAEVDTTGTVPQG